MRAGNLTYLLILAVIFTGGCKSNRDAGRADARRDLAKGVLAMETWGLGGKYNQEYFRLLRERFGIKVSEAGCVVDQRLTEHADGYNEIMVAELEHRFGTNFWKVVMADAREVYDRKQKPAGEQK